MAEEKLSVEEANAKVSGKWLLRSHGAYKVLPPDAVNVSTLSGGAYVVKDLEVVGLADVAKRVAALRQDGLAEGLVVSSVEVISHLKEGGVELLRVPRGTRRWAIVTTVMCTAKDNPVKAHDLFFFGEAHGPRTTVTAATTSRDEGDVPERDEQPPRKQPAA